jgi:hypothetical protein
MNVYEVLCMIGIPSIISGAVALLINREMAKRDRRQAEMQRQNNIMEQQNKAIMAGVQAMLRDRLLQGYRHYINKGWADYDDRQNLENIWNQYHSLGANGVMDDMRAVFRRLPTRQGGGPTNTDEEETA